MAKCSQLGFELPGFNGAMVRTDGGRLHRRVSQKRATQRAIGQAAKTR